MSLSPPSERDTARWLAAVLPPAPGSPQAALEARLRPSLGVGALTAMLGLFLLPVWPDQIAGPLGIALFVGLLYPLVLRLRVQPRVQARRAAADALDRSFGRAALETYLPALQAGPRALLLQWVDEAAGVGWWALATEVEAGRWALSVRLHPLAEWETPAGQEARRRGAAEGQWSPPAALDHLTGPGERWEDDAAPAPAWGELAWGVGGAEAGRWWVDAPLQAHACWATPAGVVLSSLLTAAKAVLPYADPFADPSQPPLAPGPLAS